MRGQAVLVFFTPELPLAFGCVFDRRHSSFQRLPCHIEPRAELRYGALCGGQLGLQDVIFLHHCVPCVGARRITCGHAETKTESRGWSLHAGGYLFGLLPTTLHALSLTLS